MKLLRGENPESVAMWASGAIACGVQFAYHENDRERWYETQVGNVLYHVYQLKAMATPCWFVRTLELDGDRVRMLNTAMKRDGTVLEADPLYVDDELPLKEWLRKVGTYIKDGHNPWED